MSADLAGQVPLRLDLGSGGPGRRDCYGLDHLALEGVDIVADLNAPLDLLPDNSVAYLFSNHCLEHIAGLLPLMREIHRIAQPSAIIELVVPHFSNTYAHSDPTHVRFFGLYSMNYFADAADQIGKRHVQSFYTDVRFRTISVRIEFYRDGVLDKLLRKGMTKLVNSSIFWQDFYERRLCHLFHARQLRYVLQAVK